MIIFGIMALNGVVGVVLLRRRRACFGYRLIDDTGIEVDLIFERRQIRWRDIQNCDADSNLMVDGRDVRVIRLDFLFFKRSTYRAFINVVQQKSAAARELF
jgi:hypothetical protein